MNYKFFLPPVEVWNLKSFESNFNPEWTDDFKIIHFKIPLFSIVYFPQLKTQGLMVSEIISFSQ